MSDVDQSLECSENDIELQGEDDEQSESKWLDNLPEWCKEKKYQRYWTHYQQVQGWYRKNHHAYNPSNGNYSAFQEPQSFTQSESFRHYALSNSYASSYWMNYHYINMQYHQQRYNQVLQFQKAESGFLNGTYYNTTSMPPPTSTFIPHSTYQNQPLLSNNGKKKRLGKRSRSREKKRRKKQLAMMDERQKEDYGGGITDIVIDVDAKVLNQEDEIIECHMEITDEMLEFFAQSAKHREQRDALKEEEEEQKDDYIDISRANTGATRATTEAPKEQPGTKRTNEMKMLYGKGAAMIHGMETALQLTYDRNLDLRQPKLWPHLPLNIKFD